MANSLTTQTIIDGPRNLVVKVTGILDTSDLASTPVVDPAGGQFPAAQVRIKELQYAIEDGLTANLYWAATADELIATLNGRGELEGCKYGGLTNNAGAGKTGLINLSTEGWSTGRILSFTLLLQCIKEF